jgi:hypothetical protein
VQVASGRGGNTSTMPAAAFKVDVMAAKRAEHQGTIAAHYTNLEHPAVVGRHRNSAEDFEPEPAQDTGATATTAADVDVDGAVGSHSRSRSSQKKAKRPANDLDTDMHDQQKLGNKGRLKNAEGTKIDAVASDGPGSGSGLERSWVPDIVGSGGTGRFRDEDFYLSAQRPDRHAEEGYAIAEKGRGALEANVLDLMGEDNAALIERKRKVWDNKKKRYVTLQKVCAQNPASF